MWYALKSGSKMCFNCLMTFLSFIALKAPCKYAQTVSASLMCFVFLLFFSSRGRNGRSLVWLNLAQRAF